MTERKMAHTNTEGSPNIDPLSGEPGAHPVGVGLGAAGAGAAGAAIGTMAGPIGTAVGAVIGAVAGGLAGKGVAEAVDPTVEDAYWRENYSDRPYVTEDDTYEDLAPAYRHGWESRSRYKGRSFDEVETDLARDWSSSPAASNLSWDRARYATRDAWDRVDPTIEIQPRRSSR
jgi:hypothetical protein